MSVPDAGWYPDSLDARMIRWWDGAQWTRHLRAAPTEPPAAPAAVLPSPEPATTMLPAPAPAPPGPLNADRVAARVAELLAARAAEREAEQAAAREAERVAQDEAKHVAQDEAARAEAQAGRPERVQFEDLVFGSSPAPELRAGGPRSEHAQDTIGAFSSEAPPQQSRAHGRRSRIATAGLVVVIVGLGGCSAYLFPLVAQASALPH